MGFEVRGKIALVTGANRGIGRTIVESLVSAGASKVYGAVRDPASLTPLVEAHGEKVQPVQLDLTKPETIESAAADAREVELVVNNAGVFNGVDSLSPEAVDRLRFEMDGNVYGLLRLTAAFAPILKQNGGGALAQLNSIVSIKCFPHFATYCASKAASYAVTQALREQLSEQGTAVVSVHPGPIATDMGDAAGLTKVAEPPQLVADALLAALERGDFHAYAGSMARSIGEAYRSFAEGVVEAEMSES